jgi:hypothetical protein
MKYHFKLGVAFCVIVLGISAFAGSITTNTSGAPNAVPATFNYSSVTRSGFAGTVTQTQSGSSLSVDTTAGGAASNSLPNLQLGSDSPVVPVTSARGGRDRQQQVPEGGTQLSYLAACGLALFAGIFIAGKQGRRPTEN